VLSFDELTLQHLFEQYLTSSSPFAMIASALSVMIRSITRLAGNSGVLSRLIVFAQRLAVNQKSDRLRRPESIAVILPGFQTDAATSFRRAALSSESKKRLNG
jgi:ABC-type uncharacterized transport system fused permease/ATPase subunit